MLTMDITRKALKLWPMTTQLQKDLKSNTTSLSNSLIYGFSKIWQDLKVVSSQKMKIYRAIVASGDKLNAFYRALINFDTTQYKTNPEQIYNIYEKGISIVYTPP